MSTLYISKINLSSFSISVALHVLLILVLILVFQSHTPPVGLKPGPPIIQASIITNIAPTPAPPTAAPKPVPPSHHTAKKLAPPASNKQVINVVDKKAVAELALKKRKQEAAKKATAEKRRQELAAEHQAAKEKKLAEQKLLQQQQETLMQQQMAQEQQQLSAARAQEMQGVVDKYKALILQQIGQNWIVPPNVNKQLSSELFIRLAPDGTVIEVKLARSSGNAALDQSAITAVYKASPLPVPNDPQAFQVFREFQLTVRPETVENY